MNVWPHSLNGRSRHHHGRPLVALCQDLEQELGAARVEMDIGEPRRGGADRAGHTSTSRDSVRSSAASASSLTDPAVVT